MNAPRQTSVKTMEPVLVELHSDGFVHVYGSKNVRVSIVNRPHAATVEAGILAEQLLDLILPPQYKTIYFPGMIRATGQLRMIKPSDIQRRMAQIDLLHAMNFSGQVKQARAFNQSVLRLLGGGR